MKYLGALFIMFVGSLSAETWRAGEVLALPDGGSLYVELLTDTGQKQGIFFDGRIRSTTRQKLYLGTNPDSDAKLMTQKEEEYYLGVLERLSKAEDGKGKSSEWKRGVILKILEKTRKEN